MSRLLRAATFRARALRRSSTPAELALWDLLRGRRVDGAKFRRQQPVGPYFVDFFCKEAHLVVEADGAHHRPPPRHDVARDAFLRAAGLTILRVPNQDILVRPASVIDRIRDVLTTPLSLRERGRG